MRNSEKKILEEMTSEIVQSVKQLSRLHGDIFNMLCKGTADFMGVLLNYAEENILGEESLKSEYREINALLNAALGSGVISGELITAVDRVSKQVNDIIPKKLEVVFFCYKASMADCFESIFRTALADPECDAYFVPIPYYDLDGNLQPIEMHLEAEGYYPEGFPLTDYRVYDAEKRRPDVIFIMNPYDDHNRSTRVHEDYYSSRLRNYTKHLTYIEYGLPLWVVRDGSDPNLKPEFLPAHIWVHHYIAFAKGIEDMFRHFLAPGTRLGDYATIPIDDPEDRFMTMGSPKFDKLVNTKKEDYAIPDDWNEVIGNKRIILYATSLTELLQSSLSEPEENKGDAYFSKMMQILETFEKHPETVIWWRPHPLFETTLASLRPKLFAKYRSIVSEFKKRQNGIFDTSPEITRAILYCDGMISDESSLLWLALAKGKPFYIPAVRYARKKPRIDSGTDYSAPLAARLSRMRRAKGANVQGINTCIWWHHFLDEDLLENVKYENYPSRFIDFIDHTEKYPEYDEYCAMLLQMYKEFVANPDGSAGRKIYEYMKEKALNDRADK